MFHGFFYNTIINIIFSVDGRLASDLDRINTDDLISCSSSEIRNVRDAMDTTSGGFENGMMIFTQSPSL